MKSMAGADQRSESSKPEDGGTSAPAADQTVSTTDDPTAAPAPRLPSPDDPTRTSTGKLENEPPISLRGDRDDRLPAPLQIRDPERYQIIGEHGRGGLGRVFRARDKELGRDVAVKELLKRGTTAELRFFREALITARLEHPGIVPVHEAGRWPDGTPFYAMKLVQGRPLKALIDECKTLEERLALLPHVIAVADAIAYAHDRKIIHRDLKPSNVIVGDFGETVVIDWGLAKDLADEVPDLDGGSSHGTIPASSPGAGAADGLTAVGSVLGTPAYMAPEQARGEPVDERADVYSLGAILQVLSTTAAPTKGDSRRAAAKLDSDLTAIIAKALSPAHLRYRTARSLSRDLRAYRDGVRVGAREYDLLSLLRLWVRRHRSIAAIVSVSVLVVAGVASYAFRETISQRDRATSALREASREREQANRQTKAAEAERDRARRAQAGLLLTRDPTEAKRVLDSVPAPAPEDVLLVARAAGSVTSRTTISFAPHRVDVARSDRNLTKIAVITSASELHSVDIATGLATLLDNNLLSPRILTHDRDRWLYGKWTNQGPILASSDSALPIANLSSLPRLPSDIATTADSTYLLTADGDLFRLSASNQPSLIRTDVLGMKSVGERLAICTERDGLMLVENADSTATGQQCQHSGDIGAFGANSRVLIYQRTETVVATLGASEHQPWNIDGTNIFMLSENGVVAGIQNDRRAWHGMTNSPQIVLHPTTSSVPTTIGAGGDLAVWGYMDGSVEVVDTLHGLTWRMIGHDSGVTWAFADSVNRLAITTGGTQLRIWPLPDFAPADLVSLPCTPFNLRPDHNGRFIAFDCVGGLVGIIDSATRTFEPLHQHRGLSFGLAWYQDSLCSGGGDGRVLCTDTSTGETREAAHHSQPIRSIASNTELLAYAVGDGSVWAVDELAEPARRVHAHSEPVYRLALSENGIIISGAVDGTILVTAAHSRPRTTNINEHKKRVGTVVATQEGFWSAGWDGTIWQTTLRQTPDTIAPNSRLVYTLPEPVMEIELAGDQALVGSLGSRWLFEIKLSETPSPFLLDTGLRIFDVHASPLGSFSAAATQGEIIIHNRTSESIASIPFANTAIRCLTFSTENTLIACGPDGHIYQINVTSLPFVQLPDPEKEAQKP